MATNSEPSTSVQPTVRKRGRPPGRKNKPVTTPPPAEPVVSRRGQRNSSDLHDASYSAQKRKAANCPCGDCAKVPKKKSNVRRMCEILASPKMRSSIRLAIQASLEESQNKTVPPVKKFMPRSKSRDEEFQLPEKEASSSVVAGRTSELSADSKIKKSSDRDCSCLEEVNKRCNMETLCVANKPESSSNGNPGLEEEDCHKPNKARKHHLSSCQTEVGHPCNRNKKDSDELNEVPNLTSINKTHHKEEPPDISIETNTDGDESMNQQGAAAPASSGDSQQVETQDGSLLKASDCDDQAFQGTSLWKFLPEVLKKSHKEKVLQWLDSEFEMNPHSCLPRQSVYELYDTFCKDNCICAAPCTIFGRMMLSAFPRTVMRRLGSRSNSRYYYMGLDIKANSLAYTALSQQRILTEGKPKFSRVFTGTKS